MTKRGYTLAMDDPLLTLRPITESDETAALHILKNPDLSRRTLFAGLREVRNVRWARRRRSFGVRFDRQLFGYVELLHNEDDGQAWELSVVFADHKRSLDAGRSAIAAIFYAFEALNADVVWFWVKRSHEVIHAFAEQAGFTRMNEIKTPGGETADVYELTRDKWRSCQMNAYGFFLETPVEIRDTTQRWVGTSDGFQSRA